MTNNKSRIKDFQICYKFANGLNANIKRIEGDAEFQQFKLIPISNTAYFDYAAENRDPLKLPKLYTGLTYFTGKGDNYYDDYKGSFSFKFELDVEKQGIVSKYLYHIYHYRSYIEFSLYQIVSKEDIRNSQHFNVPDERMFSEKDISIFSINFCNELIKQIEEEQYVPSSFLKYSDSNLILFGYSANEYFCTNYETEEEYIRAKASFKYLTSNGSNHCT